jgi:hypothetical protein
MATTRRATALVLLLLASTPSYVYAMDRSCVAVQTTSASTKLEKLGSSGEEYKPVLEAIAKTQNDAVAKARPAEEAWIHLIAEKEAAIRAANPDASDGAVRTQLQRWVRQSVEADNLLARQLVAQYELHIAEMNQKILSHQIPEPDNTRRIGALAGQYVAEHGSSGEIYDAVQQSPTFRHLISTLAAAEVARSARGHPGSPLSWHRLRHPAQGGGG